MDLNHSDLEKIRAERDQLQAQLLEYQRGWPPGHFYSPIPSLAEIKERESQIFGRIPEQIPGIDLNVDAQLQLLHELKRFYPDQPFTDQKQKNLRYCFQNPNYTYGEAVFLFCLLRYLRPHKVIEIGSGYSSCAILDTNELFFDYSIACTYIEPYPELLFSLLKKGDQDRVEIVPQKVQDVCLDRFKVLTAGDILFIDSSHVSKAGSDVNHILFEILPILQPGVIVHFHDIAYPFEYPKEWIYQGRAWNEAYLLRAFLQYNDAFRIRLFNSYLGLFYYHLLEAELPVCTKNPGTSIWLQKT